MQFLKATYRNRFSRSELTRKKNIWLMVYKYFLKNYISQKDTVLEMGAGYCELLNLIKAKRKIAVDPNPDTKKFAGKGVEVLQSTALKIPKSLYGKIDVIILSHFLEHLNSKDELVAVIQKTRDLLKDGGKVLIMQPNIDLTKEAYWNFVDHKIALNTQSVIEALETADLKVSKVIKHFLPYTTKSSLSIFSFLAPLYLSLPPFLRPLTGQSFFCAVKEK
ncbi:MAG: methyltransferase domain-containing protein [Patescibacteria group bacterium]